MTLFTPACIDHTLLTLSGDTPATEAIQRLCDEANQYGFAAVCVRPEHTLMARQALGMTSQVKVATVIGFPSMTLSKADEASFPQVGQIQTTTKLQEISSALMEGSEELDVVMNVSFFKTDLECKGRFTQNELHDLVSCAGDEAIVKLIIETDLLTPEEIDQAVTLAVEAGVHMIKTSTGMLTDGLGATVEAVERIAQQLDKLGKRNEIGIKASAGIRTREQAEALLAAGATRLGTSKALDLLGLKASV